jgi:hypothetical protein
MEFIVEALWDLPYYLVLDALKNASRKRQDYWRFLGSSFELYITSLLKLSFGPRFRTIDTGVSGNPLNDGVVFLDQDVMLVFEIKKYRPTTNLTVDETPITESEDFEKRILDGFQQLSNRIEEYVSSTGFSGRLVPFLVTMGFIPMSPQVWELMNTRLSDLFVLRCLQIDFPVVSDPLGIEVFTAAVRSGVSAIELLDKRDEKTTWRQGAFKDFLYEAFAEMNLEEPRNEVLVNLFEDMAEVVAGRFGSKVWDRDSVPGAWRDVFPWARELS